MVLFAAVSATREERARPNVTARLEPAIVLETSGGTTQQTSGAKEEFRARAKKQVVYEGGKSKSIDVEVNVGGRGGRDFILTGHEATTAPGNAGLDITGQVHLRSSDGFEVATEAASYVEAEGVVRAPGALTFNRGGMSGSAVGMTYDRTTDVLTLLDQVHVTFTDENGTLTEEFTGGGGAFDRRQHRLTLERHVHGTRGTQEIEGEQAVLDLTASDERVTYVAVRGGARVVGGTAAFDSMSADAIDLDYSDDGAVLERLVLAGKAAVALTGASGTPGRQFFGESLTVALAPDNTVTQVVGRGKVRVVLPAGEATRRRTITARTLDATGVPGQGLTAAVFGGDVELREEAAKPGEAARVARAQTLNAGLSRDAMRVATLGGGVTFGEQGLTAVAPDAAYDPDKGTLRLTGAARGGRARVADTRVSVEADAVDLTIDGHGMMARGAVRTTLQAGATSSGSRTPGVFEAGKPVNINADLLEYNGSSERAIYRGAVQMWQGDNAIRANEAVIDRHSGDLRASGDARAVLVMDGKTATGRGDEMRYFEERREIEYRGGKAPAQLTSAQGTMSGERILLSLAASGSRVARIDSRGKVALLVDARKATASRLVYDAEADRYTLTGAVGQPVRVVQGCDETSGHTLTFFRATDRIIVDGNEQIRTQTKTSGGNCPPPRAP